MPSWTFQASKKSKWIACLLNKQFFKKSKVMCTSLNSNFPLFIHIPVYLSDPQVLLKSSAITSLMRYSSIKKKRETFPKIIWDQHRFKVLSTIFKPDFFPIIPTNELFSYSRKSTVHYPSSQQTLHIIVPCGIQGNCNRKRMRLWIGKKNGTNQARKPKTGKYHGHKEVIHQKSWSD